MTQVDACACCVSAGKAAGRCPTLMPTKSDFLREPGVLLDLKRVLMSSEGMDISVPLVVTTK